MHTILTMKNIKTYEGFFNFLKKKKEPINEIPNITKKFTKDYIEMLLQELKDDYEMKYEIIPVRLSNKFDSIYKPIEYAAIYKDDKTTKPSYCLLDNVDSYLIQINAEISNDKMKYSNLKTFDEFRRAVGSFLLSKKETFELDNIKVIKPINELVEDKFGHTYLELTTDFILQLKY